MAGFEVNNNGYQVGRNVFQPNKSVRNEEKVEIDLTATTPKQETKEIGDRLLDSPYASMGLNISSNPMTLALKELGLSPDITTKYGPISKGTEKGFIEFTNELDSFLV